MLTDQVIEFDDIMCCVCGVFFRYFVGSGTSGDEYYLYNIYYDRVLGQKADASPVCQKLRQYR